jgi:hypothetical protein
VEIFARDETFSLVCDAVVTFETQNGPDVTSVMEWDALPMILEGVISRGLISDKGRPLIEEGLALMRSTLSYNTTVLYY